MMRIVPPGIAEPDVALPGAAGSGAVGWPWAAEGLAEASPVAGGASFHPPGGA